MRAEVSQTFHDLNQIIIDDRSHIETIQENMDVAHSQVRGARVGSAGCGMVRGTRASF